MDIKELLARTDTTALYQPFVIKIQAMLQDALSKGMAYYATCGMRTYAEQEQIYAEGRTAPGKIVTKAHGGQSYHNFGIAIDFCRDSDLDKPGLQPSWRNADYQELANLAHAHNLEPGFCWHFQDPPHVQLHIAEHGLTMHDLDTAYRNGGIATVYSLLDRYKWT